MLEKIILNPKLIELNSTSNDIYMTLKMIILTSNVNSKGLKFNEEFIDGIITNQSTYIGIPLVVNRTKLENGIYSSLGHEFDGINLKTDMIGSFVSFEKVLNEDSSFSLIGEARIQKRFLKTCEAILDLYEDDNLNFSCEVLVYEYAKVEDKVREVSYADGKNQLIGNCIVTSPAEKKAKPTLLVASLDADLGNGGNKILLTHEEIHEQLRVLLNPNDNEQGGWKTSYYTWDMATYDTHCVVRSADDGKLYRFDYEIQNEDTVALVGTPREQMVQYVDVPEGENVEVSELFTKYQELDEKVKNLSSTLSQKESELNSVIEQKTETEKRVEELASQSQTQVEEKNEAIIKLNQAMEQLNSEIASLKPIKDQWDAEQEQKRIAELNEKKETLKAYALSSKVITEKDFENEEIKAFIEELNESAIKSLIADRIVSKTVELNSNPSDVIISTNEPQDLIPATVKEQMYAPRKSK